MVKIGSDDQIKKQFDELKGNLKNLLKDPNDWTEEDFTELRALLGGVEKTSTMGAAIAYFLVFIRIYYWEVLSRGKRIFVIFCTLVLLFLFVGGDGIVINLIQLQKQPNTLKIITEDPGVECGFWCLLSDWFRSKL